MKKNNKGFSLIELLVVVLILSVLAAIALPQYRSSTREAQITSNLPIMKALQDDMVNFYNLNGSLPTSLFQLSLNRAEFKNINGNGTAATSRANDCTFSLSGTEIKVDCNKGWVLVYNVEPTAIGYKQGKRLFEVTNNEQNLKKIANNLDWKPENENHNIFNISLSNKI